MFFGRKCCAPMMNMNYYGYGKPMQPTMNEATCCQPIQEPTITNCVEKEFYHEVPHVCNYHTHYVNKHIYKHTYTPQYSCSEEEVVFNDDPGCCGGR